jgi:hypothetical protein
VTTCALPSLTSIIGRLTLTSLTQMTDVTCFQTVTTIRDGLYIYATKLTNLYVISFTFVCLYDVCVSSSISFPLFTMPSLVVMDSLNRAAFSALTNTSAIHIEVSPFLSSSSSFSSSSMHRQCFIQLST